MKKILFSLIMALVTVPAFAVAVILKPIYMVKYMEMLSIHTAKDMAKVQILLAHKHLLAHLF